MFEAIKQWRIQRIIRRLDISEESWVTAFSQLPLLQQLTDSEKTRMRELAVLLLHKKSFSGAHGLAITTHMKLIIALQACLPILNLSINWYRGWHSIIVYPSGFIPEHTYTDEAGVVHREKKALSGEAWSRGPLILSWDDTQDAGTIDGENLVIHEFAHKLDMRNGVANGFPPLHKGMDKQQWSQVFSDSFTDLQQKTHNHQQTEVDSYAAHSPAEFFAVISELFFERPDTLNAEYPAVYQLLSEFYRQNPLARFQS